MPKNTLIVLIYHRHKLLNLIYRMLIIYTHTGEVNRRKLFRLLLPPWEKQERKELY
jgi:hypothetical protein